MVNDGRNLLGLGCRRSSWPALARQPRRPRCDGTRPSQDLHPRIRTQSSHRVLPSLRAQCGWSRCCTLLPIPMIPNGRSDVFGRTRRPRGGRRSGVCPRLVTSFAFSGS